MGLKRRTRNSGPWANSKWPKTEPNEPIYRETQSHKPKVTYAQS